MRPKAILDLGGPVPPGGDRVRQSRLHVVGASLGLKPEPVFKLIARLERGLPFKAMLSLEEASGIGIAEIAEIIAIPERTLARRRTAGWLTPDESERLLRLSRVIESAVRLFDGDMNTAISWLRSPARALGNRVPLNYARREPGAREVENLIGRIEDGIFS
jgi:putative toxin-antitoxin system antitoxin component (TIGR02293 family)